MPRITIQRNIGTCRGTAVLLIVFAISVAAREPTGDTVTFHFAPACDHVERMTYRVNRLDTGGGQPPIRTEGEGEIETACSKIGDSYELRSRVLRNTVRRNGVPVVDPVTQLLARVEVTYEVSSSAKLIRIRGFEKLESIIKTISPPQLAAGLAMVLNEESLVAKEQAEWEGRYSGWVGREFKIGEQVEGRASYQLPTGQLIEYTTRTSVTRREPCPAGSCVRIVQVFSTDPLDLTNITKSVIGAMAGDTDKDVPSERSRPSLARISGESSRLLDPSTMIHYEERRKRTMNLSGDISNDETEARLVSEERTYEFRYE